jgi:trans-aconitate 2-methyltransferase
MTKEHYTFGDNDQASARLRRLAELYEPETRELLLRGSVQRPPLAVDLGCGPGWSTRLIHDVLKPERTVGLDASERYVAEARGNHGAELEFMVHDVVHAPFPVAAPNVMFCRFLLTHLRSPEQALRMWARVAKPDAVLFVHETESLETENRALLRYYELVGRVQRHYGQELNVGALLESAFEDSGWTLGENERRVLKKPAHRMADLHLANLRTWRHDPYASQAFDRAEIESLETALERIARETGGGEIVVNAARQIVAKRRLGTSRASRC